jgi:Sulfotransferase family
MLKKYSSADARRLQLCTSVAGRMRRLIRMDRKPSPTTRLRTTLSRLRQTARAKRARRGFESRLIWLFGSPRSGSSWLLQMLASHPAVVQVNEPLIGGYLGPILSDSSNVSAAELEMSNFTLLRAERDKPESFFSREFEDVWAPALGTLMVERFLAHSLRYPSEVPPSRTIVAIKEPNGSQSADVLISALPRARLLFLLRDGRDVVDSELAANLEGAWLSSSIPGVKGIAEAERVEFVKQSAYKWLWRTEVVQEAYRAHAGPKYLIQYEKLRQDPTTQMKSVFEWAGLKVDDAELATWIERRSFERIPSEARGPHGFFRAARPGMWRESLTAEEQAVVEAIIGPKIRELGYDD